MIHSNQELLDATYKAFVVDKLPFGYDKQKSACLYLGSKGQKCAIGLHLKIESGFPENGCSVLALPTEIWLTGFTQGVDRNFANEVQKLHDRAATKAVNIGYGSSEVIETLASQLKQLAEQSELLDPAREN